MKEETNKSKIILDSKTGKLLNVIFDSSDLSKTTAELRGNIEMQNNQMLLHLILNLNENIEVVYNKKEEK